MTNIVQSRRRILGMFIALALVVLAVSVASPARAAEDVGPQGICEGTGWVRTGSWIGEVYSPWFYSGGYKNIQFKVTSGLTYKRTDRDCKTYFARPGQASEYRHYSYDPKKPKSYSKWSKVTKGCTTSIANRYWGYNYGAGGCNTWTP
jgi:hypothetical protein